MNYSVFSINYKLRVSGLAGWFTYLSGAKSCFCLINALIWSGLSNIKMVRFSTNNACNKKCTGQAANDPQPS